MSMIKFVEWAKSSLPQQTFASLVANLFRQKLFHRTAFQFQSFVCPPPKKKVGRGLTLLVLPLCAENPRHATVVPRRPWLAAASAINLFTPADIFPPKYTRAHARTPQQVRWWSRRTLYVGLGRWLEWTNFNPRTVHNFQLFRTQTATLSVSSHDLVKRLRWILVKFRRKISQVPNSMHR